MIGLALNFDFGEIKEISSIKFNLRSINKTNIINKYKLYAITDGGEIFIRDISISTDLKNNTISLGKTIKAKAVKLVALNDSTDLYNIASLQVKQINKELKQYSNISIINVGEEKDISTDLNELKLLEEGTVIARFNATDTSSVHSILGISNNNTNNGYFSIYIMASRVGVEIRNQTELGNTSNGTTNLAHIYGDVTLNAGINTIAFKVTKGVGYTLYLNGVLIKETKDGITNFINSIQGLNNLFIGKTKRYSGNEYLFKGNIDFIRIYNKPLSNEYLIKETIETKGSTNNANLLQTTPQIEKIEIVKNKVYKAGENISFKIKFSETVSIIGSRQLDVSINNIISTFAMSKVNSGKEYIFTGTLPLNLSKGSYGLTIKSNSNIKFIGIFNKIFNISSDILLDNKVYIEGVLENISTASLKTYENLSILTTGQEINKSIDINDIKTLTEGTIITKFNSTDNSSVHSILGISNSKTNNGYLAIYVTASRVGVEIRSQTEVGNTSNGTTNLAHVYADVTLNSGVNTIAFKVTKGIGYSLYLNGVLVNQTNNTNTKFLSDIVGLDTIFIGKTKRNLGNEYLFKGNIDYIKIYKEVLSNDYLLMKTGLTRKPNENEVLQSNIYKSATIDVFKPGDLSSNNFRIPSLITTKKGTLIAGIDARKGGGQDSPNNIDTAVKISKDGGLNWDSGKILIDYPDKASTIDSSLLQDRITERVFLLVDAFPNGYGTFQAKAGSGFKTINNTRCMILLNSNNTEFYLRPDGKVIDALGASTMYTVDGYNDLYKNSVKIGNIFGANSELKAFGTSYLILIYSDDEGVTWSAPKFISSQFKKEWMTFLGTGPGRGIQLKNGTKAGRLIFPVYYLNGNSKQSTALIYSDDKGLTWNIGKSPNDGRVEGNITISSQTLNDTNNELTESAVVEMPNGQLKIFMRNRAGYVRVATSFDYGESWDKTVELDKGLKEPYCQLSIINYSKKFENSDVVIFSNPDATSRSNGSIKIGFINQVGTYSNGETKYSITWKYNKVIKSDYFAYSCLTETLDGKIGLFYEGTGNTIMSYTTMALDYISYNIQQSMAKIKFIVFDNMKYEVGDTISFKILFDQPVSIIGSRVLDVMLNNILIKFNITEVNGTEYLFTSKIPLNMLKGKYNITIKANNDMKIINIYNLSTSISTDILLSQIISIEENVIKNNNDNVVLIKFYEDLENSNDNSQNYIIEYDSNIFTLDEGQKSNNGITTTTKKLNNEVVQQTVSKI